jgi:hypothetical protein
MSGLVMKMLMRGKLFKRANSIFISSGDYAA